MKQLLLGMIAAWMVGSMAWAQSGAPITTDSRIKTFVYNENDVFTMLTHYGYQSNVEFGRGESVQTVSVGDRIAWQIIPSGRRLFIKAMEENAHTNMTVVTNKRAYQFDLRSSGRVPLHPSEELVYVVRFFYPDEQPVMPAPALYSDQAMAAPVTAVAITQPAQAPMPPQAMPGVNYNYTYTGPQHIAPVKIYDDGKATYFKFAELEAMPQFFVITPDGREQPVQSVPGQGGEMMVSMVAPRFSIRQTNGTVMVFNERFAPQQAM